MDGNQIPKVEKDDSVSSPMSTSLELVTEKVDNEAASSSGDPVSKSEPCGSTTEKVKKDDDEDEIKWFDVTAIPKEMWWEICKYLDHGAQKRLRNVHPFLYETLKEYKVFHDNSVMRYQNQHPAIFQELAEAKHCWRKIGLEIANGVFKENVPEIFFERCADRLTSLSFTNCEFVIPVWLYNIVDRCPNLISLSVIGGSGFIPPLSSDDFVVSTEVVWPSIRNVALKRSRNKKLTLDLILFILTRVSKLEELSVIGITKDKPGTKGLRKNPTKEQIQNWEEDAEFIMTFVMPYVRTNSLTLRKLNLSYHLFLASEPNFITQLIHLFRPTAHEEHQHRRTPALEELDLTMCEILGSQLSEIASKITTLKRISCSLVHKRCSHRKPENSEELVKAFHPPLYRTPLSEPRIGRLTELNVANSVSLGCICFIGQMKGLLHLDASYCPNIRKRHTLLNGIGPAFGPYPDKLENSSQPKPKFVVWKLKTFKFAGNQGAQLDIKRLILYNVTHLDLSFSDCIQTNEDFVHICHTFRKLEILKLSGSTGEFRLNRLKNLKRLKELRLRSCRMIDPIQFETNVVSQHLMKLDIADTKLTFEGLKNIIEKNRCLVYLDLRGCENVEVEPFDPDFYDSIKHVSLRHGIFFPKGKEGQARVMLLPITDNNVKESPSDIDKEKDEISKVFPNDVTTEMECSLTGNKSKEESPDIREPDEAEQEPSNSSCTANMEPAEIDATDNKNVDSEPSNGTEEELKIVSASLEVLNLVESDMQELCESDQEKVVSSGLDSVVDDLKEAENAEIKATASGHQYQLEETAPFVARTTGEPKDKDSEQLSDNEIPYEDHQDPNINMDGSDQNVDMNPK